MNAESPKFFLRRAETPRGEELIQKTIDTARETFMEIYPQLKKNYAELMGNFLSSISLDERSLNKLSSPDQRERMEFALGLGIWGIHNALEYIPDQENYGNNTNNPTWKELMRNNLSQEDSQKINLPDLEIIARGAKLFAKLPGIEINDSPSIGNGLNEGIIKIIMQPFSPKFSRRMNNLISFSNFQTKEMTEARKTLENLDTDNLIRNKDRLLDVYLSSMIPAHIVASSKIPPMSYPK